MSDDDVEVVFHRGHWLPRVLRAEGQLLLENIDGSDAFHDPRRFTVPTTPQHLEAIRSSPARQVLLRSALSPLWYDAGTVGPLDEQAALAMLDLVLLGEPETLESVFAGPTRWDQRILVAYNADPALLARGELFAALRTVTEEMDWNRVKRLEDRRGLPPRDRAEKKGARHALRRIVGARRRRR